LKQQQQHQKGFLPNCRKEKISCRHSQKFDVESLAVISPTLYPKKIICLYFLFALYPKRGADKRLSHVAFTRTVLGVLLGVVVLAVDALNPVKLFLHVFPTVEPWHIALVCMVLSTYIWISEFKELLYFIVKVFLNSILSIFFRDIEVIGRDRLPRHGPMVSVRRHKRNGTERKEKKPKSILNGIFIILMINHS
jgi:hypothetical protein